MSPEKLLLLWPISGANLSVSVIYGGKNVYIGSLGNAYPV